MSPTSRPPDPRPESGTHADRSQDHTDGRREDGLGGDDAPPRRVGAGGDGEGAVLDLAGEQQDAGDGGQHRGQQRRVDEDLGGGQDRAGGKKAAVAQEIASPATADGEQGPSWPTRWRSIPLAAQDGSEPASGAGPWRWGVGRPEWPQGGPERRADAGQRVGLLMSGGRFGDCRWRRGRSWRRTGRRHPVISRRLSSKATSRFGTIDSTVAAAMRRPAPTTTRSSANLASFGDEVARHEHCPAVVGEPTQPVPNQRMPSGRGRWTARRAAARGRPAGVCQRATGARRENRPALSCHYARKSDVGQHLVDREPGMALSAAMAGWFRAVRPRCMQRASSTAPTVRRLGEPAATPVVAHLAPVRTGEVDHHPHGGGLAGAVGTDEAGDPAGLQVG